MSKWLTRMRWVKAATKPLDHVRPCLGCTRFTVLLLTLATNAWCPGTTYAEAGEGGQPATEVVVATVHGNAITDTQLRTEIARRGGLPAEAEDRERRKLALLDELIRIELFALAAAEAGLDKDPEVVEAYRRMLAERFWREQLTRLTDQIKVSDQEVAAYYESHRDQFLQPARARGAMIFFRYPARATEEEKQKIERVAKDVLSQVRRLDPAERFFGDLASEHSADSASARRKGDIGWVVEGASLSRWEPVVVRALFALQSPGDLSAPLHGERGVYLVRLVEKVGGKPKPLADVEVQIRKEIHKEKGRAVQQGYIAELRQRYDVVLNEAALKSVGSVNQVDGPGSTPPAFPVGVRRVPK